MQKQEMVAETLEAGCAQTPVPVTTPAWARLCPLSEPSVCSLTCGLLPSIIQPKGFVVCFLTCKWNRALCITGGLLLFIHHYVYLRFIHVEGVSGVSVIPRAVQIPIGWVSRCVFLDSIADGHLGCFLILLLRVFLCVCPGTRRQMFSRVSTQRWSRWVHELCAGSNVLE